MLYFMMPLNMISMMLVAFKEEGCDGKVHHTLAPIVLVHKGDDESGMILGFRPARGKTVVVERKNVGYTWDD